MTRFLLPIIAVMMAASPVAAVQPDEMLADPVMELRAREISKELRCVVCQNESIDESNAELARDLRLVVRDRLMQGDADDQVIKYVVDRYGDYVLLRPPFKASTYILWFGPLLFAVLAVFGGWRFYKARGGSAIAATVAAESAPPPLSAEERRKLDKLLKDTDGAGDTA
ncbi:MAG: cytochrome c-type biogenesis protein [Rhodospirillaceae bacterium]